MTPQGMARGTCGGAAIRGVSWGWMGSKGRGGQCATSLATMSWTPSALSCMARGRPLSCGTKPFRCSPILAHRDRVVPKHELLEHLWPDQFVGDAVLKACITALRKALGEQGRTPRFVRTLHGQGYRFVAAVEAREHLPVDGHAPPSLAALPSFPR